MTYEVHVLGSSGEGYFECDSFHASLAAWPSSFVHTESVTHHAGRPDTSKVDTFLCVVICSSDWQGNCHNV